MSSLWLRILKSSIKDQILWEQEHGMTAEPLNTQAEEDAEMPWCYKQFSNSQILIKGMQFWDMVKTSFRITKLFNTCKAHHRQSTQLKCGVQNNEGELRCGFFTHISKCRLWEVQSNQHHTPLNKGFGMLMTCLNLSPPHYQTEPVPLGPRDPAKKFSITSGERCY